MTLDSGRARHYRDFYQPAADDRPLWLVVGNCQAEALRLVLDAVPDRPYRTARMPPVHELQTADLPYLRTLLAQTSVLFSQPIRTNYRDLPIGTADLAAVLPPAGRVVRWPVIRYAGLYPFQAIVRHPADRSVVPPVVPYHDLRTVVAARDGVDMFDVQVSADAIRAVAEASVAELARREHLHTDVGVSDVLLGHGAAAAHTINHPGNPVLLDLAARILNLLDVDAIPVARERELLSSVYAPLDERVLNAHGLDVSSRPRWRVGTEEVEPIQVHNAQLDWYRANPDYIPLAMERHGHTMNLLGLSAVVLR